jgi:hypothetical protein
MNSLEDVKMKKFLVPVTWQVSSYVVVAAENAEDAIHEAYGIDLDLIPNPEYVGDSFETDCEAVEELKHCLEPGDKVYWNDPDDGICSGVAFFRNYLGNDVVTIEKDDVEMEVYVDELS